MEEKHKQKQPQKHLAKLRLFRKEKQEQRERVMGSSDSAMGVLNRRASEFFLWNVHVASESKHGTCEIL